MIVIMRMMTMMARSWRRGSVKCLLHKHKDQNSDPQELSKNQVWL